MPNFDGRGPLWNGNPGAGFGTGPCGQGMQRGFGRGFGRAFSYSYQKPSKADELKTVEADEKELEEELAALKAYKKELAK